MDEEFTEFDMWYLWCATTLFKYLVIFPTFKLLEYLTDQASKSTLLWKFLSCILPCYGGRNKLIRNYQNTMFGS